MPDLSDGALVRLEFPGWGTAERIDDLGDSGVGLNPIDSAPAHRLGLWKATAICGNDITSSTLYVAALCTLQAGALAPVALALVATVLYLFRSVYAEVGSALPLNGGAYNVLLNTTTKAKASVAACLTVLSYIATAVLSSNEAAHYAHNLFPGLDVMAATVALLAVFAILNLLGISESASVALAIFVIHMVTLSILVVTCGWAILQNPARLADNVAAPLPGGWTRALFFGFSAAMLGISGFESSANFIEEQQPGVFPLTLRNMWSAVAFFNPVISLIALGMVSLSDVSAHQTDLLAHMGWLSAGEWLRQLVSLDATLVLAGAVLTSYVGVNGLVRRMSLDQCLPQFLLAENRWRKTNHWIILLFFALCCSILSLSAGKIETLAGVYTLSFLGVMILFAVGNILLKMKRERLRRDTRASWPVVIAALVAVVAGLLGTLMLNPAYVRVFGIYFAASVSIVTVMLLRIEILKASLILTRGVIRTVSGASESAHRAILERITRIHASQVVYFTRGDDLPALNRAALYVLQNELTNNMKVVHCFEQDGEISPKLADNLRVIDQIYPKLKIDLVLVKGKFGPQLIEKLSRRLRVPKNYMFISTPGDQFPHNIAELGGVRLIL
ncbi:MAG: APC family permease [Bryobacterales bacterium]|nr:APC family permease [Bryobacterales bacterium]